MQRLDGAGVQYIYVNVNNSEKGREVLAELGRNALGMTTRMTVPTTIVGRKVIRGSDAEAILKALKEQAEEASGSPAAQ